MKDWAALEAIRIGCVQYLNARPLIHGYAGPVIYGHPSDLAREIGAGELDAGLVPVFEALGAREYALVDGVAIACDGPVYSVYLAYRGNLEDITEVALDPGSLTSVHLLKVLLAEYYGLAPHYAGFEPGRTPEAMLLIGNQAIEFRRKDPDGYRYLDLGEAWKTHTGLPFVFALWMLGSGVPDVTAVANGFRALQRHGLGCIDEIVAQDDFQDAAFRREYLTRYIRYGLEAPHKEAMELFGRLLAKHGLTAGERPPLRFV